MKYLMTLLFSFFVNITMGQVVENFTAIDVASDKEISLDGFSGNNLIVVVFFSNNCAFTKHYVDRIKQLEQLVSSSNSTLILVNSNSEKYTPLESEENMQRFIQENNLNTPYLADKDQSIAKAFGARRTPEAFVLQFENGGAQVKYKGAIDDNAQSASDVNHAFLNDAVRNLLAKKEVEQKSTRANGCLIK